MKLASTSCRPLTLSQGHPYPWVIYKMRQTWYPRLRVLGLSSSFFLCYFWELHRITGLQSSELLCSRSAVHTSAPVRQRLCWTVSRRTSGDNKEWLWSVQAAGLIPDGPQTPQRSHSHKRTIPMLLLSCCRAIFRHVTVCPCYPYIPNHSRNQTANEAALPGLGA